MRRPNPLPPPEETALESHRPTGGIGSGKSTVAQFFRELGATVIDADAITHQIFDLRPEVIPILLVKFGS